MRLCRHWGVAYLKSWDNYLPCNNLKNIFKNYFLYKYVLNFYHQEETTAAHQLAGELDKRVPHGERGEREELEHTPGPGLLQLYEHTHTRATFSILRGNYFNWKFCTALLTKFEGIMKSFYFFLFNFYQKRTQSELPVDILSKRVGWQNIRRTVRSPLPPTECGMSISAEKDLLCQLGRRTHRTRTNHLLRGRASLKQATEQNSICATHERHIGVWQGREVTILIPENFRAKSISWEYFITMRRVQCTKRFIKLGGKKSPHVKSINQIFQLKNHPMIYTFAGGF